VVRSDCSVEGARAAVMYLPASPAARKREEENRIRARLAAMDGRITALVALGVGAEASILAFTHADVDEVGRPWSRAKCAYRSTQG
jgi:hypothetical protein